jgi:hypothetical protein
MDKIVYLPPDADGVRRSECGRFWSWSGWEHGFYTHLFGFKDSPPHRGPEFVPDLRSEAERNYSPPYCYGKSDLFRRLRGRPPWTPEAIALLTRDLLQMWLDGRLDYSGGYPADVDWDSFLNVVVVADLDAAKEYAQPCLNYYSKQSLRILTELALEDGPIGADGRRLRGDEMAEAIYEYFCEGVEDCEASHGSVPDEWPSERDDAESEPDPAEGEAR